jgi:hypothetical protein
LSIFFCLFERGRKEEREGKLREEKIYIELAGEASKSGLTIDTWKDMESELLWSLYDDMFACRIPTNHMVVFWTF